MTGPVISDQTYKHSTISTLWIRRRLQSRDPGVESHAHLFQFVIEMWCEKHENKQKEAEIGPLNKSLESILGRPFKMPFYPIVTL